MVDLGNPKCQVRPTFNKPGGRPRFCAMHRTAKMVDVGNRRCEAKGCKKQPVFGLPGETSSHCTAHKTEDMVHLRALVCHAPDCTDRPTSPFLASGRPTAQNIGSRGPRTCTAGSAWPRATPPGQPTAPLGQAEPAVDVLGPIDPVPCAVRRPPAWEAEVGPVGTVRRMADQGPELDHVLGLMRRAELAADLSGEAERRLLLADLGPTIPSGNAKHAHCIALDVQWLL